MLRLRLVCAVAKLVGPEKKEGIGRESGQRKDNERIELNGS
jgi:hypothetical protein